MRKSTQPAGGRLKFSTDMVFDYELRPSASETPRELILLLHGFEESGKRILTKLDPVLPPDAVVLAPNGLFPFPRRTDQGFKLGYSWYLYNPATKEYFIDMAPAISFLAGGLRALGLAELPKRLIGFSQGGYLAPIAAARLGGVRQVIGLACEFLVDEFPPSIDYRIDGVFGARDEVISIEEARSSHAALASRSIAGELKILQESGHSIDDPMRAAVAQFLTKPD